MNFAICLAGGTGSRMGAKKPKQFLVAAGKPIIVHTLSVFFGFQRKSMKDYTNELNGYSLSYI